MSRHERLSAQEVLIPTVDGPAKGSHLSLSLTPAAVSAATAAYQNFTVAGLLTTDTIIPAGDPISNATALTNARCTTAGTMAVQFANPTAGSLTPTAGTYKFLVIRTE